jgi:hypothetical protein
MKSGVETIVAHLYSSSHKGSQKEGQIVPDAVSWY